MIIGDIAFGTGKKNESPSKLASSNIMIRSSGLLLMNIYYRVRERTPCSALLISSIQTSPDASVFATE
jgi:hypothetical protein